MACEAHPSLACPQVRHLEPLGETPLMVMVVVMVLVVVMGRGMFLPRGRWWWLVVVRQRPRVTLPKQLGS
jgi:hypothetical protein